MGAGIPILGTVTQKCKVTKLSAKTFQIVLTQGLNRQIRRMCEYLGYEVVKLQRTRIMNVKLASLPLGHWRELTEKELAEINTMVATSSKTEEASVIVEKKETTQPKKKPARQPNDFNKKSASFRKNSPKSKRTTTHTPRKKR